MCNYICKTIKALLSPAAGGIGCRQLRTELCFLAKGNPSSSQGIHVQWLIPEGDKGHVPCLDLRHIWREVPCSSSPWACLRSMVPLLPLPGTALLSSLHVLLPSKPPAHRPASLHLSFWKPDLWQAHRCHSRVCVFGGWGWGQEGHPYGLLRGICPMCLWGGMVFLLPMR